MNEFAVWVTRDWREGVCHFCGIRDEQVDGDRIRWYDAKRRICSQPGCVRRFQIAVEQEAHRLRRLRRTGKRTPAQVHEQILEERKARRRAARLRRKGKAA